MSTLTIHRTTAVSAEGIEPAWGSIAVTPRGLVATISGHRTVAMHTIVLFIVAAASLVAVLS